MIRREAPLLNRQGFADNGLGTFVVTLRPVNLGHVEEHSRHFRVVIPFCQANLV